ncbi:MAG: Gp138 family membrane-puncturing spike protein [Campylobacterota bacterium]|nr:Gp138 family membrane-puncturing spike protein [Campylobacterota bacterium]
MTTLAETINIAIDNALKELHTSLPAKVLKFNSAKQTVNLELQQKRLYIDDTELTPPPLVDVPVQMFRAGGFSMTMPISVGDTGFVVFAERSLDEWQVLGEVRVPEDSRTHSVSDGVFFPTLHNDKNPITSYSANLEIRTESGNGKLAISPEGKIELSKDGEGVLDIISQTLGVLESATVTVTTGSSAGTYNLDNQSEWADLKVLIDGIKL